MMEKRRENFGDSPSVFFIVNQLLKAEGGIDNECI